MTIFKIIENNKRRIDYQDLIHILAFVLRKSEAYILANFDYQFSLANHKRILKMINLRKKNYPLAYLKQEAFFYHLKLKVNEDVLIPRPATEKIVDLIMEEDLKREQQCFLDIGCGSGAIIIALADLLRKYRLYSFNALDISQKALQIAKLNSRRYHLKINFKQSDLLNNFQLDKQERKIITANLPYLNQADLKEDSIKYEPKLALLADDNGLALYKKLIIQLKDYNNLKAYLEIKPEQEAEIKKSAQGDFNLNFQDDLSKKIRIAILER